MTDNPQPIRSDAIYVSYKVRKALRYVATASRTNNDNLSADSLADSVLWEWLKKEHPKVVDHIEANAVAESTFADELKVMLSGKTPF